jgi:hypothetical protein
MTLPLTSTNEHPQEAEDQMSSLSTYREGTKKAICDAWGWLLQYMLEKRFCQPLLICLQSHLDSLFG